MSSGLRHAAAPWLRGAPGGALLAIVAIALGVALAYAVHLVNSAAAGEFEQALRVLSGSADLTVHGPRTGFPEELYAKLASRRDIAAASPMIELEASPDGRRETFKVIGVDIFRAAQIQPELASVEGAGDEDRRLDFLRPDRVFLSRSAAQWLGVEPGDAVTLQSGLSGGRFVVAGILSSSAVRERLALMDIAGAQSAFGRLGTVSRIELRLKSGARADDVASAVAAVLPPGVLVEPPQARIERTAGLSRAYRVNLDVLALVAIFTGGLLVFSSQALAVVRRRSEFALLRALGVTRGGVIARVLVEASLLGIVGGVLGLALGHALAQGVLQRFGADLGAGFFRGIESSAPVQPAVMALFALLGVLAAAGGSFAAAREAARAEPAQALRAGDEERAFSALHRLWPGVSFIGVGAALSFAPPISGLPLAGYAAIALLLIGALLLMPRAADAVFHFVPALGPPASRLAVAQLRGASGPAGVSLAAIVASVALMTSMAIMVFSFRTSLDTWLQRMLPADVYVRVPAGPDATLIGSSLEARLSSLDGVAHAEFMRLEQVVIDPARPPVALLARTLDRAKLEGQLLFVEPQQLPPLGAPPPAWVSESFADLYSVHVGSVIEVPVRGRNGRFTVAGVWRDYVRQQGAVLIERAAYEALGGSRAASEAALWLRPGADAAKVSAEAKALLPAGAQADVAERGQLRELSLRIFDRTFGITYALEAVAVLIGLFALAASFGTLALARRREFGVLRHVGMTRGQVGAMLACEGTLVSALGLAAGLVLGWIVSLILIHVVNRQSFHWSMDLHVPWRELGVFTVVLLALASLAAWLGARRAMTQDAVRAVSEAW